MIKGLDNLIEASNDLSYSNWRDSCGTYRRYRGSDSLSQILSCHPRRPKDFKKLRGHRHALCRIFLGYNIT
jgi:hypothetical protein